MLAKIQLSFVTGIPFTISLWQKTGKQYQTRLDDKALGAAYLLLTHKSQCDYTQATVEGVYRPCNCTALNNYRLDFKTRGKLI